MKYLLGHVLAKTGKAVRVTVVEYEGDGGKIKKGGGEVVWLPMSAIKAVDVIEYYENVEFEVINSIMKSKGLT